MRLFGESLSLAHEPFSTCPVFQDCQKSCSPLPPDVPAHKFLIGGLDGWLVIAMIGISVLLLSFFTTVFIGSRVQKRREDPFTDTRHLIRDVERRDSSGFFIRVRTRTERFLQQIFFQ